MNLQHFTDGYLAQIRNSIESHSARYTEATPWITPATAPAHIRNTGLSVPNLRPLLKPEPGNLRDLENSKIIHEDLRSLKPVHAADERLWVCLAHTTYWDYMVARWGDNKPSVILDRFFLRTAGIGSLVRHGISRLWWFAHLTRESKNTDPFELTETLLSSQDIQTGLLQRKLGRSEPVRKAVLTFFKDRRSDVEHAGKDKGGIGEVAKHLFKELNLAGGVYILDALPRDQIGRILTEALASYQQSRS